MYEHVFLKNVCGIFTNAGQNRYSDDAKKRNTNTKINFVLSPFHKTFYFRGQVKKCSLIFVRHPRTAKPKLRIRGGGGGGVSGVIRVHYKYVLVGESKM